MRRLTKRLLEKSQEAIIVALETYNRVTIQYRIESFCIFFTNAWELLLKAKIIQDSNNIRSIFYPKQRGMQRRSLSIGDSLNQVFRTEQDPVRKNIEDIVKLRDTATHLVINDLDRIYAPLFQAGILNYIDYLNDWFSINLTEKITPGMLSLVFDKRSIDPVVVKRKHGSEVVDFIIQRCREIEDTSRSFKHNKRYRVSIEYKVALVKNPKKADIVLSPEIGKGGLGFIEVPQDINKTHPCRLKECVKEIKSKLRDVHFTNYTLRAILHKENMLNSNNEYHFCIKSTNYHHYSEELVDYVVDKVKTDPNYLTTCLNYYRRKRGISVKK